MFECLAVVIGEQRTNKKVWFYLVIWMRNIIFANENGVLF